jgi:hypothetical protein
MVPVNVTGGRFFPASVDPAAEVWFRLVDGQTSSPSTTTTSVGWGVRTTSTVSNPYITLNLDGTYSDILGVGIWPLTDSIANIALGQNLTVWLHNNANFSTETAPLLCRSGTRTVTVMETSATCMNTTSGYRYVTIQRFGTSNVQLGLQEVRIYRSSKLLQILPSVMCCAVLYCDTGRICRTTIPFWAGHVVPAAVQHDYVSCAF